MYRKTFRTNFIRNIVGIGFIINIFYSIYVRHEEVGVILLNEKNIRILRKNVQQKINIFFIVGSQVGINYIIL